MENSVYIVGVKHCGKSTVGKLLSELKNLPFYDLDSLIEERVGSSVRDFYRLHGKDEFQKIEAQVLDDLENKNSTYVCATGGGISDNQLALSILKNKKEIIYINTPFETVYSRIIKSGIPSFLKSNDPKTEFQGIFNKRNIIYKDIATKEIDGRDKTPNEIIDIIMENKGA